MSKRAPWWAWTWPGLAFAIMIVTIIFPAAGAMAAAASAVLIFKCPLRVRSGTLVARSTIRLCAKSGNIPSRVNVCKCPSDGSARQPLDMGPALPQLVLDALETAVEMIDTVDHRLPLGGKPSNYERHRGA